VQAVAVQQQLQALRQPQVLQVRRQQRLPALHQLQVLQAQQQLQQQQAADGGLGGDAEARQPRRLRMSLQLMSALVGLHLPPVK